MSLLSLESIEKSFLRGAREIPVLRDVSLEVRPGELVAIYGERGAGKTTLLKLAAGFERPRSGTVNFDGKDLARLARSRLARLHRNQIGWVERSGPQSRELPMRNYVALGVSHKLGPRAAQRQAAVALAKVGVEECADQCWDDISDTARMLVAIAHALVREPRLLIVDDPTATLGIIDRERIVGLLRSAAEDGGLGILMAVPDMPAMLHAHQVRSLSRGRLLGPIQPPGDDHAAIIQFPDSKRTA